MNQESPLTPAVSRAIPKDLVERLYMASTYLEATAWLAEHDGGLTDEQITQLDLNLKDLLRRVFVLLAGCGVRPHVLLFKGAREASPRMPIPAEPVCPVTQ